MTDRQVLKGLIRLYRIIDASEKGFLTAATNTPDLAQKILFRFYAQQRQMYQTVMLEELHRLGLKQPPDQSITGAIHRGRVAIMAGMAVNDVQRKAAVIHEVAFGEKIAIRAYEKALSLPLPPETREWVARQYSEVRDILLTISNTPDLDTLEYQEPVDSNQAVRLLARQGVPTKALNLIPVTGLASYPGTGATLAEVVLSGAVGGAIWGGLMGVFAGIGVVWSTNPPGFAAVVMTWFWVMLAFVIMGAFISSVLGLMIGLGIAGEDRSLYAAAQEQVERKI